MARKWYESAKVIDIVYDVQPIKGLDVEAMPAEDIAEVPLMASVPVESAHLGLGANTFSGEILGRALIVDDASIDPGIIKGQEKWFSLYLVKDKHELNEKMEVSASASYSGLFSASAKTKFVHEHKFNSESVYLLVSVQVTNSRTQLIEYTPSDGFTKIFKDEEIDWENFLRKYGNQFVFSIVSGGEFYALYEFHTQSMEQKNAIEAAVKGGGWGFQAESEFKKELEKIDSNVEITCKLYIRGGTSALPKIQDDQIIEAALNFPTEVAPESGAPVAYKAETKVYDVVDEFPGYPKAIRVDLESNEEICNEIVKALSHIEELEYTFTLQGDLDEITEKKLSEIKKALSEDIGEIAKSPMESHEMPSGPIEDIKNIEMEKIWTLMPGKLAQISVGSHQHVWGVAANQTIHKWNSKNNKWDPIIGNLVDVSVGADGTTWGVMANGTIYRWDIDHWLQMPMVLKKLDPQGSCTLKQISVGSEAHIWGINPPGDAFQWQKNDWLQHASEQKFEDLSVGSDGTVMLIEYNRVLKWFKDSNSIAPVEGQLSHISVGNAKEIWGIDTESRIVRWDGETWQPLPGERRLKSLSVGGDGTVWGVDGQGNVYRLNRDLLDS
jgi:virginiamycin B lyase